MAAPSHWPRGVAVSNWRQAPRWTSRAPWRSLTCPPGTPGPGCRCYQPTLVASRGGTIDLLAPEGLQLDGLLRGAGGNATAEGGQLALGVSRLRGFNVGSELLPTFPTGPRQILVTSAPGGNAGNGVAEFDAGRASAGGFDSLCAPG